MEKKDWKNLIALLLMSAFSTYMVISTFPQLLKHPFWLIFWIIFVVLFSLYWFLGSFKAFGPIFRN